MCAPVLLKLPLLHLPSRNEMKILLILSIAIAGCSTTVPRSDAAENVQVLRQSNSMAATCKRLAPLSATVGRVAPAQVVYDQAVDEVRGKAALAGADSVVLLNSNHTMSGLSNIITVQAAALKCYEANK